MSKELGKSVKRIIQIGDSSGIILPKEYLRRQGIKRGDMVELFYDNVVKIKPVDDKEIRRELGEI